MRYSAKTNGFYPENVFYPDLPDDLVFIDDSEHSALREEIDSGMLLSCDDSGYPFAVDRPTPTAEELRTGMIISKVKAIQNLKQVGKLNLVLDLMDALPRDNDVRILWDFSETLHRTDPMLVKVCKEKLGLDDRGIDNLFL